MIENILLQRNIVLVSALYPPEPQISALMSFDLANKLASQGHYVTVLCPQPSRPLTANYCEYKDTDSAVINFDGKVKVVRLPSFNAPQSKFFLRMWESISFGMRAVKYLVGINVKVDVIYINAWPIFAQSIISSFARIYSVPFVLQIMDIYPESIIRRLPYFLKFIFYKPLQKLDTWIANAAKNVVVISENMKLTYIHNRSVPNSKVIIIPTWQDDIAFKNIPSRIFACEKYCVPNEIFTFLFLGNIGPVAGVDFLIRAFFKAKIKNAQLLIIGDGASKISCMELSKSLNLTNIYFISDPESANVPFLQSMAHVCLLPMKQGYGKSSIPSKLPSYLFSAKPIIASVDLDSDTAEFVRQAKCGWVGEAENLTWLANKMKDVIQLSSTQLDHIGQRGKKFGLLHFSKSSGVNQLAKIVLESADTS